MRALALVAFILAGVLLPSAAFPFSWEAQGQGVWPPPPAQGHVFFIRNIETSRRLNVRRSIFAKIGDFVFGKEPPGFMRPSAVVMGDNDVLYFTSAASGQVQAYSPARLQLTPVHPGAKEMAWGSPVGIAVSPQGVVYIADSALARVMAVGENGKMLWMLGENEGLARPSGVFFRDGKLYVADSKACQVFVFDGQGKELFRFGRKGKADGEFNTPTALFVDARQRSYVSDTLNCRVQIFDEQGRFIKSVGSQGDSSGSLARPRGVAVDAQGHIYIVDALFDNVQVFDDSGRFLMNFGTAGHGEGEFWIPAGIAIDRNDFIYVADTYNQRISIFQYRP